MERRGGVAVAKQFSWSAAIFNAMRDRKQRFCVAVMELSRNS